MCGAFVTCKKLQTEQLDGESDTSNTQQCNTSSQDTHCQRNASLTSSLWSHPRKHPLCFVHVALFDSYSKGEAFIDALSPSQRSNVAETDPRRQSMLPTPAQTSYIEDGYNITRTDAPKDLGGRLCLNCARTTPELPYHVSRDLRAPNVS